MVLMMLVLVLVVVVVVMLVVVVILVVVYAISSSRGGLESLRCGAQRTLPRACGRAAGKVLNFVPRIGSSSGIFPQSLHMSMRISCIPELSGSLSASFPVALYYRYRLSPYVFHVSQGIALYPPRTL